jgi:hypothetical protein
MSIMSWYIASSFLIESHTFIVCSLILISMSIQWSLHLFIESTYIYICVCVLDWLRHDITHHFTHIVREEYQLLMSLVIKEPPEVFLHFLDLQIEWIFNLCVLVHDIRIDKTNSIILFQSEFSHHVSAHREHIYYEYVHMLEWDYWLKGRITYRQ